MKQPRRIVPPTPFQVGVLLTAAILLSAVGVAAAQTTRTAPMTGAAASANSAGQTGSAPALSSADRRFIEDVARDGMAEVAMGKIVQQRATNGDVKAFAQKMIQDHTKVNAELAQLAARKGVALPAVPDNQQRRYTDALGQMKGADIDRAYMKRMVDEHEKDVSDFKKFAGSTEDPDLKAFASRTLADLESHLGMAQRTHQTVDHGTQGKDGHGAVVLPADSAASR